MSATGPATHSSDAAPPPAPGAGPDIVAAAAAEADAPGADTTDARECPFCVMMREGGCEEVFKAFMDCGTQADKGEQDMAQCLPQFSALSQCMERNKDVFDVLLKDMAEEEQRAGQRLSQQQQQEQQQQTQQQASVAASSSGGAGGSDAAGQQHHVSGGSAAATGVPAAL